MLILRPPAHPRSRGEHLYAVSPAARASGSSPLTRGARIFGRDDDRLVRLIPAHAGSTGTKLNRSPLIWAHPRSRGEHTRKSAHNSVAGGSSPLTRGALHVHGAAGAHGRLIPAHAGSTHVDGPGDAGAAAHPRSRGEHLGAGNESRGANGSSPLTRGARETCRGGSSRRGLIPAHAGSTH